MARMLANSAELSNSPINNSVSKQTFSFSKSPRFRDPRPYCESFYNSSSMLSKRSSSIGYGDRFYRPPVTSSHAPAPCTYTLPTDFGTRPKQYAYTFGLSREAYKNMYLREHPPRDKNVPVREPTLSDSILVPLPTNGRCVPNRCRNPPPFSQALALTSQQLHAQRTAVISSANLKILYPVPCAQAHHASTIQKGVQDQASIIIPAQLIKMVETLYLVLVQLIPELLAIQNVNLVWILICIIFIVILNNKNF